MSDHTNALIETTADAPAKGPCKGAETCACGPDCACGDACACADGQPC
jgi:hypothetical protein